MSMWRRGGGNRGKACGKGARGRACVVGEGLGWRRRVREAGRGGEAVFAELEVLARSNNCLYGFDGAFLLFRERVYYRVMRERGMESSGGRRGGRGGQSGAHHGGYGGAAEEMRRAGRGRGLWEGKTEGIAAVAKRSGD